MSLLHDGQVRCLQASRRFNVVPCGRRWGKTTMGLAMAYYGAPHAPRALAAGYGVGWFAPTYRHLTEAWIAAKRFLAPVATRVNGTDYRIEIGPATLEFWNLGENVGLGRRYGLAIIDEAAIAYDLRAAWEAIRPSLTDYRGGAFFFSTPRGLNFFHELYDAAEAKEGWARYTAPSADNPHLAPEEIEAAREDMADLAFRQEYLAEFVTFGAGLVKTEYLVDGVAPPGLPVTLGVDLAISTAQTSDWSAIVAASLDQETGIFYVREAERFRGEFHEILNRIKAAAARWKPVRISVEQTQFQAAVVQELVRTTRLPVRGVSPDRDKVTRLLPLLTRYERRLVRHDPARVPAWFREELLAFPEGQHDDGVDAAVYAFGRDGKSAGYTWLEIPGL